MVILYPRRVLPFLAWGDFHARSRFAGSTIPEEKWGTTRSLGYLGSPTTLILSNSANLFYTYKVVLCLLIVIWLPVACAFSAHRLDHWCSPIRRFSVSATQARLPVSAKFVIISLNKLLYMCDHVHSSWSGLEFYPQFNFPSTRFFMRFVLLTCHLFKGGC